MSELFELALELVVEVFDLSEETVVALVVGAFGALLMGVGLYSWLLTGAELLVLPAALLVVGLGLLVVSPLVAVFGSVFF